MSLNLALCVMLVMFLRNLILHLFYYVSCPWDTPSKFEGFLWIGYSRPLPNQPPARVDWTIGCTELSNIPNGETGGTGQNARTVPISVRSERAFNPADSFDTVPVHFFYRTLNPFTLLWSIHLPCIASLSPTLVFKLGGFHRSHCVSNTSSTKLSSQRQKGPTE